MRFFILILSLIGSVSQAKVEDFNKLLSEASQQEKRLHRKLLQSIQNTRTSIAYEDRWQRIRGQDISQNKDLQLRLVQKEN